MNLKKLFCFLLAALIALPVFATDTSRKNDHRYKVAACDWMMLKRQKLGAFKLLRELGGDGLYDGSDGS